jgi:2-iminobutanoate/2-iminopropanoate deaminase
MILLKKLVSYFESIKNRQQKKKEYMMSEKIETSNAPKAIGPYTQAIKVNGLVFTSGQIALHPVSNTVEATTIEAQTEQVIQNLKAVLEKAGSSLEKAVKTTCFLKEMSDFGTFNEIYAKYFTGKPARSCVAAKELPKNVLIEIDVNAEVET